MPSKPHSGPIPASRRAARAALVLVALSSVICLPAPAASARHPEATGAATRSSESTGSALSKPAQSLPTDGTLTLEVRSAIPTDTPYYEVRFQVVRPGGGLMLQKTEVLHDLAPGRITVRFERELASLGLHAAAYPVRVRIRFGDDSGLREEQVIEDRVFVYDRERDPVPVALVVRLASAPALDPEGRFVTDPAVYTADRDAAIGLAERAPRSGGSFSLAVPPFLLDQWRRASEGYRTVGPEGAHDVSAEDPTPLACARALKAVGQLAGMKQVELLDVPYAEPDLRGLDAVGTPSDLDRHYSRGVPAYLASLDETPSAATLLTGGPVPDSVLPSLARRGLTCAVVTPESLAGAPLSGGAHRIRETTLTALVSDGKTGERLAEDPPAALDDLFERYLSDGAPAPLTTVLEVGAGHPDGVTDVSDALETLRGAPWIRTVTVSEAAQRPAGRKVRLADPRADESAPADYWPAVKRARSFAAALSAAAGENDSDAEASWYLTGMAQSRAWAGAEGSWSLADRGRAYAGAAQRRAGEVLKGVVLQVEDVTLAGQSGDVPINISNRTKRPLRLALRLRSSELALPGGGDRIIRLKPGDNYVTVPVDLSSALAGRVGVGLYAGPLRIEDETIVVRASYLDRIALVAAVAAVLIAMLFFIKRRVDTADAAIIGRNGRRDT